MVLTIYCLPAHLLIGERHPIRPEIGAKASASHGRPSPSSAYFQEASRPDIFRDRGENKTYLSALMGLTKRSQNNRMGVSKGVTDEVCATIIARSTIHTTLETLIQSDAMPNYHAHPLSPFKQFLYALAICSHSSDPSPVDVPFPSPFFKKQLPGHLLKTQSRLA